MFRAVQSASKSVKKIYQMFKRKGGGRGGVRGILNNVKKTAIFVRAASLTKDIRYLYDLQTSITKKLSYILAPAPVVCL